MLILTESTYQRTKGIGSFLWTRSTGKTWFLRQFCQFWSPIKMNSGYDRTHFSCNFWRSSCFGQSTLGKSCSHLPIFKKSKWTFWKYFFFFVPWHQGKQFASILTELTVDSYPWPNAKTPIVELQQVPQTTDAAHTPLTLPFFDFMAIWAFLTYLMTLSVTMAPKLPFMETFTLMERERERVIFLLALGKICLYNLG